MDAYAIIADPTEQATSTAIKILDKVGIGRVKRILHHLIIYEVTYHREEGDCPSVSRRSCESS